MQLITRKSLLLALPNNGLKVFFTVSNSSYFQHNQFWILNLILLVQFNLLKINPLLTVFRLNNKNWGIQSSIF